MNDPDICHIEYCGFKQPKTPEELEFEILGLKTAIREAQKRIATLEQSAYLVQATIKEQNDYQITEAIWSMCVVAKHKITLCATHYGQVRNWSTLIRGKMLRLYSCVMDT